MEKVKYAIHYTGLQLSNVDIFSLLRQAVILDNNPHHWKFTNNPLWN